MSVKLWFRVFISARQIGNRYPSSLRIHFTNLLSHMYTYLVVLNRRQNPLHHDITLAQLLTGFISYSYCTEAICKVLFWYVAQSVLAKVKPEKPLDPSFISYDLTAQCRYLPANYEIRISRAAREGFEQLLRRGWNSSHHRKLKKNWFSNSAVVLKRDQNKPHVQNKSIHK